MKFANRLKFTAATATNAAVLTFSAKIAGYRSLAEAISSGDLAVGDKEVPIVTEDASGNWENSYYTVTNSTMLTRESISASSNNGQATVFSGALTAGCQVFAEYLKRLPVSRDIPFGTVVSLVSYGESYMPPTNVTSGMSFTPAANAVRGALVYLRLIGNGNDVPTFGGGFKEDGTSMGFDQRSGVVNKVQMFFDGSDYLYSISQAVNASAVDSTAPTVTSVVVANSAPTSVDVTFSETMDTTKTPAASAFAVSGHTVSSASWISATVLRIVVSAAFVYQEAATLAYTQPATNGARDSAGNLTASFSGRAITNNVGAASTAPTSAPSNIVLTPTDGGFTFNATPPANGGSAITNYTLTITPAGGSATTFTSPNATLPFTVTGKTNGVQLTVTAHANNAVGAGPESGALTVTPNVQANYDTLFNTNNFDAVGSNPVTYAAGINSSTSWQDGNGGVWTKHLAANTDGTVQFKIKVAANYRVAFIANDHDRAYNDAYVAFGGVEGAGYTHGVTPPRDNNIGTGTTTAAGIAVANGDVVKVTRTGSTYVAYVSKNNGSTFTEFARQVNGPTDLVYVIIAHTGGLQVTELQSTGLVAN